VKQAPLTKLDLPAALAAGGLALLLYGRTVTPGLLAGDSGEFQTLAYLLGNTHPTGYPVYIALARMFGFVPLGDPAYRINLLSAVLGAVTIAGVYLCGRLLSGYRAVAFAGALALAASPTLWSQAIIAEVYTTGAALLTFILLALLWWDKSAQNWALYAAGLLGGLSLGVHMSVALLAPAVLLFMLFHWRRGWKMWVTAVMGALSGLAIVVLLFALLDWHDSPADYFNSVIEPSRSVWGLQADQIDGTLERLLFGWQGDQFQYLMFANIGQVMPQQASDYAANLGQEIAWPLLVLAVMGVLGLLWSRASTAVLLVTALIIQLVYFFNYEAWDLYVFYIPSYLLLVLLAVAGMGAVLNAGAWSLDRLFGRSVIYPVALDGLLAALVLAFAVWPVLQIRQESVRAGEIPAFDFAEYPEYDPNLELFAAATVAELPQNGIVFTDWDMMWPYYYAAFLRDERRDLSFVETLPADDQDEVADSLVEFVWVNREQHPLFFDTRSQVLEQRGDIMMSPVRVGPARFHTLTRNASE
jgi:4-amino-4-deoxy-L-arabinose transferase-like glycosyltransferase